MTTQFSMCSLDDLAEGGVLFVGSDRPWWLDDYTISSTQLVQVAFHGLAEITPSGWIGEGGSPCLRAVMVSAARQRIPAIMTRHDPKRPGWARGTEPVCMTLAYMALTEGIGRGFPWWRSLPAGVRLRVASPEKWASADPDVSMTAADRAHGLERAEALRSFVADPTQLVPGLVRVGGPHGLHCRAPGGAW